VTRDDGDVANQGDVVDEALRIIRESPFYTGRVDRDRVTALVSERLATPMSLELALAFGHRRPTVSL
jgi:hypothetical protein